MQKLIKYSTAAIAALAITSTAQANEPGAMYFKAEAGYAMQKHNYKSENTKLRLKGFHGGVGLGYYATPEVRTDLTVDFTPELKKSKKHTFARIGAGKTELSLEDKVKVKESSMRAMVNASYDFNTEQPFTPYLTAGVGLIRKQFKFTRAVFNQNQTALVSQQAKTKNKTGFAYQAGVGVAYEMSKGVYADLSYKIGGDNISSLKIKNANEKFSTGKRIRHMLTAGIRVAF